MFPGQPPLRMKDGWTQISEQWCAKTGCSFVSSVSFVGTLCLYLAWWIFCLSCIVGHAPLWSVGLIYTKYVIKALQKDPVTVLCVDWTAGRLPARQGAEQYCGWEVNPGSQGVTSWNRELLRVGNDSTARRTLSSNQRITPSTSKEIRRTEIDSWLVNNTGLNWNCSLLINTTVRHDLRLAEAVDAELQVRRADCGAWASLDFAILGES